jgi:aryl-alcohol dehydrogenase-like predicted oxidoreductase
MNRVGAAPCQTSSPGSKKIAVAGTDGLDRAAAPPAQIAIAWLLAQKPWIVPIPGTTKLHRLDENIAAVEVELTSDDLHEIETGAAQITPQGARYPESAQRMIDR